MLPSSQFGMGRNRGTLQAHSASVFQISTFLLQRLIGLLTLWQKCNNIRHREHSEVRKSSQPVTLNHPFTPTRTLSIKQNPNTFSLPTHPSTHKSSSRANSAQCVCGTGSSPGRTRLRFKGDQSRGGMCLSEDTVMWDS